MFFYLFLILDVFSRKIVGWEVYDSKSSEHAAEVFTKTHLREGVDADTPALHSDNGSPMKGGTMLATLHWLGLTSTPLLARPIGDTVSFHPPVERLDFLSFTHSPQDKS